LTFVSYYNSIDYAHTVFILPPLQL